MTTKTIKAINNLHVSAIIINMQYRTTQSRQELIQYLTSTNHTIIIPLTTTSGGVSCLCY